MSIAVYYYSMGGHTKQLADAVASRLGTTAKPVSEPLEEKVDVLFLGSSLYAGKPHSSVSEFVKNNAANIGRLVCFGSSVSGKSTYTKIKAVAESCGVEVCEDYFNCPGQFLLAANGRPNAEDCEAAADFAAKHI